MEWPLTKASSRCSLRRTMGSASCRLREDGERHLAEIDMENFRTEDIRSLVTAIPSQLKSAQQQSHLRGSHRGYGSRADSGRCDGQIHLQIGVSTFVDEESQIRRTRTTTRSRSSNGPENYGKYKSMHLLNNLQNCTTCLKQQDSLSQPERNGPAPRLRIVVNRLISHISRHARSCFVRKSFSMPNVQSNQSQYHLPVGQHPLNVSQAPVASHNSAKLFDRPTTMRSLLPMYALPTDSENKSSTNGNDGAIADRADVDQ